MEEQAEKKSESDGIAGALARALASRKDAIADTGMKKLSIPM